MGKFRVGDFCSYSKTYWPVLLIKQNEDAQNGVDASFSALHFAAENIVLLEAVYPEKLEPADASEAVANVIMTAFAPIVDKLRNESRTMGLAFDLENPEPKY